MGLGEDVRRAKLRLRPHVQPEAEPVFHPAQDPQHPGGAALVMAGVDDERHLAGRFGERPRHLAEPDPQPRRMPDRPERVAHRFREMM